MGCCNTEPENEEMKSMRNEQELCAPRVSRERFIEFTIGPVEDFYEILNRIGNGSYAEVFLVRDKRTDQVKAMKKVPKIFLTDTEQRKTIKEVQILSMLDHPNIMRVFELIETDEHYFIVSEYLEGGELYECIIQNKYIDEEKAARFFKQIMMAVSYLHSKNIVHRDLKPENLVFSGSFEDSILKLIDFGTSEYLENSLLNEAIGTLIYMAPETLGNYYNEKCDIWSAGVILYTMLCGNPPFYDKKCEKKTVMKIRKDQPRFKERIWKKISIEVKELIISMLQKSPEARPTAVEVLNSPWVLETTNNKLNSLYLEQTLETLEEFYKKSMVEKSIMVYISSCISSFEEEKELIEVFGILDTECDGCLTREELLKVHSAYGLSIDIHSLIKNCNIERNGSISFSEFISASESWKKEKLEENLLKVFEFYKKNEESFVLTEQLFKAIPGVDNNDWKFFFKQFYDKIPRKVSFKSFKNIIFRNFQFK